MIETIGMFLLINSFKLPLETIGVEMTERSAYYGVRSNLVSYLSGPMGQSTAIAVVNVNIWTGVSDLSRF